MKKTFIDPYQNTQLSQTNIEIPQQVRTAREHSVINR